MARNALPLLTPKDVAARLQVSTMTIRRYVQRGVLESVLLGNRLRFSEEQVNDFIRRRTQKVKTR